MVTTLQISRALLARLHALAAADPAREVCGLLLGDGATVTAIREAANVAEDPARQFEIDPRIQIAAARAARQGGPAVIGCYHSHPSGQARPSECDRELAETGSLWLIFAGDDVTAWRRGETQFQELSIVTR